MTHIHWECLIHARSTAVPPLGTRSAGSGESLQRRAPATDHPSSRHGEAKQNIKQKPVASICSRPASALLVCVEIYSMSSYISRAHLDCSFQCPHCLFPHPFPVIHSWCVCTLWAIIAYFQKAVISTNIDFSLICSHLVLPSCTLNSLTVDTKKERKEKEKKRKRAATFGGKQKVQNLSFPPCFPHVSLVHAE